MKHPITQTHNGVDVYVDLVKSPAAAHIAAQPRLLGLVKEALGQTIAKGDAIRMERDMGRSIGYDFVTETTGEDMVFYAQIMHDTAYTRFIKSGTPRSTQYLTIVLQRDGADKYELYDAWIGRLTPPQPGNTNETADSKPYWAAHAFILDGRPLQTRTVTKECPY